VSCKEKLIPATPPTTAHMGGLWSGVQPPILSDMRYRIRDDLGVIPHVHQSPIEIEWQASDIGHAMATSSRGEPEPRPSRRKERLSKKDELNALYLRRLAGEILQAEYSELRLNLIHDGRYSDMQVGHRFWGRFTGGSIAATAAAILLILLIDPDECSNAAFTSIVLLGLLPVGLPVGIFGMAGNTEKGNRAWPVFVGVLLTLLWMLWALGMLLALGLSGAACV
jgi:hypothetical protein